MCYDLGGNVMKYLRNNSAFLFFFPLFADRLVICLGSCQHRLLLEFPGF